MMRKKCIPLLFVFFFVFAASLLSFKALDSDERIRIAAEMENSLQNELLNKWYPQSMDTVWGGFLSSFTNDFKPTNQQDKMIVTQARHTWTNAKAMLLYPTINHYKKGALHGFRFLKDMMWDKKHGGFYTLVDQQGNIKNNDASKQRRQYCEFCFCS